MYPDCGPQICQWVKIEGLQMCQWTQMVTEWTHLEVHNLDTGGAQMYNMLKYIYTWLGPLTRIDPLKSECNQVNLNEIK